MSHVVTLRLNDEEYNKLKQAVQRTELLQSEFIRNALSNQVNAVMQVKSIKQKSEVDKEVVSKNNAQMKNRYATKQVPHYGIRKLSIGVASVLLSTTLYMGVTAHADTVNRVADNVTQPVIGDASTDKDTKTPASEVTSAAIAEASFVSMSPSNPSASQGSVATDAGAASTATNTAADSAPATSKANKASYEPNGQVQSSSETNTTPTNLVRRPFMRLAAADTTDSDELIVGKDVTISDFSVTAAKGKNEFENSHANIKFTMHADDPSALAGKRLTIQLDGNVWGSINYSETRRVNPTTISYQGQVIGTLNYDYADNFVYITFNDHVKDYAKINVQSDLVVSGIYQNTLPYETDLYTPTQAKDGQTYYLTSDVTIGQQKYSSNLPSVIHYYALKSDAVSSVISLTTTSYNQGDSELYAGTFYKTPNGIYYSQFAHYSGNNLYSEQSGQSGYLEGPRLNVGTDIITDHTQSYTATIDIDQTKLSPGYYLKFKPITSYHLFKDYWDDENLLPNTSDVYIKYSSTVSSTATADATVTKNVIIFNKLNGQSLATQIASGERTNSYTIFSRESNYISQDGKLHFTPALFKQLQAAAESDQNLTEAINTVKTTGMSTTIKLVNPIDTGLKATIKTSDGKTKEVSLLIDTIDYQIITASTAPKGAILVAAQGKTVKVYHHGDQNIPAVVDKSQLTKTITRTINVHEPGKSVTTTKQTVTLTQSVSVVDGKDVTYNGDWKVQGDSQWASYDVPSVPGYTASQSRVAQQEVSDETEDQTIDINYTANEHQISIEYVDNATGHVVKTDHLSGKTGQTVSITPHVPDGWELVSGQSVPSEVTVGADGAPATVIKVQPQERSVSVKFVDDQSDGRQVGQAITVTGRDGDTIDVKLTVPDKYQLANGQQLPTTYTFTAGSGDVTIHLSHKVVQREAAVDVQIGLLTWVDFNVDEPAKVVTQNQWRQLDDEIKKDYDLFNDLEKVIPSIKVGTLTGHVNYDLVDNKVVSFGNDWTSLNLGGQTYQMPDGTEVVNGVLVSGEISWGKKLREWILKYVPDIDPDYATRPWHGYLSVNTSNIPSDIGWRLVGNEPNALAKATDDRAATAIEMSNKPIDLSLLQESGGEGVQGLSRYDFNEQDGQLRAKAIDPVLGIYIPYVEKTATRTINVTMPDGKTTMVKQTATLEKQVNPRPDAHSDWTTGEWTSYDVPTIPGYTATQSKVAKETVTGTTEDQTINITYTANPQTIHINYVDAQRKLIHTTTVNGQTDQTVEVPNEVPDGWMLYSGQSIPKSITFQTVNNDRDYVVKHVQSFVLSTAPKEAGTIIEGTKAKTYPAGVSDADLNKTVTRTILVKDANGRTVNTKTQTVHFVRNAIVDAVTGHVDYLGWSEDGSHIFAAYVPVPKNGYTINSAKATTVTPNDTDSTVELTYKPIPKTITIEYMTTDGKQVDSQNVKADDNNQVKFTAPDGYVLATNTNTVDVSDLNNNIYRVLVRANEQTYTAGSTNIPKNVKNLTKVVTRTIVIVMPNGHKRTIKQQVTFERTATVKSDGSVVYTDYQPVGHDAFNHIFIAHRFGYNLNFSDGSKNVTRVDHVTADTPDQTIVVTYVRKNANQR